MTTEAVPAGPLAAPARTLPGMLRHQADRYGDRPLLSIGEARWRHRDAAGIAARRAGALRRAGIIRGDRVALMCSNRAEFLETFLGCGWIGAPVVPLNTASMGPQIAYCLADSGAKLLVIEEGFLERLGTADLSRIGLETLWIVGGAPGHDAAPQQGNAAKHGAASDRDAVPGRGAASDRSAVPDRVMSAAYPLAVQADAVEPEPIRPGDPLAILYTSGTTGPAKGVVCPHAQYYWWGVNTARILGVTAGDVLATTLPLFHVNALNTFAQASVTGCRAVFGSRFSASRFWASMAACEATVVYLLGAMVPILLAQPAGPHERAHRIRIGLGPGVPVAAAEAFQARTGVRLLEGYGSTETNFVIAATGGGAPPGSMGWLQPGFAARVVDEDDHELPAGEAGELVLRADEPFAFASGYLGLPDRTVQAWRNLWFHTGDRVVREADGSFRFIDRIKDAIRRRGENISSFEVEQVLLSHPDVAAAAVYPVRSELAEDEVMAALVARPGRAVDPAGLARYCETRLPAFAIPRYVELVDELPRTENGKVRKVELRERGVTATTWDRQAAARVPAGRQPDGGPASAGSSTSATRPHAGQGARIRG